MKIDFSVLTSRLRLFKKPPQDVSTFLQGCLLLDLEARGNHIHHLGAILGDKTFERKGRFHLSKALQELDDFADGARAVLGHNILGHDLPILRETAHQLRLFQKPLVDTLFLSPLAFPENPYHRLIKDYKLVKDSVNDPLADARLAASIFRDQWDSFQNMAERSHGHILSFYRFCFEQGTNGERVPLSGIASLFAALEAHAIDAERALEIFQNAVRPVVCPKALGEKIPPLLEDPSCRLPMAYVMAWLRVAGGNSILPPWVLRRFPMVSGVLHALRDHPCGESSCTHCAGIHDPRTVLQDTFGFSQFRSTPSAQDGSSLQEQIVARGMVDQPLLAILPTGGGKSLCYQLPALARYRRRGLLTIVISPLQALMKDQVDNLADRAQTNCAAALYGLLTPPERTQVLERIRLGDIGILYVAPEQFRNSGFRNAISQREIGAWVFDEAHCLSKWGHDFRPDYLYAGRFIRQLAREQNTSIPTVACFTATAKSDVKQEILQFFQRELGQELTVFEGGVERDNLHFEVQVVKKAEKFGLIHGILAEKLALYPQGAAIVYTATRNRSQEISDYLKTQGWGAAAFHGGLNAAEKRTVQEAFLAGQLQVIAATNAFGMGIDKDNIRVVLHADIPGSLESYLQEAGRAGRDLLNAQCVLLYDEQDVETQFKLGAMSRLSQKDIGQILRGIRRAVRSPSGEVILTSGELLRDERVETEFDVNDVQADTKVKTAIAWLERASLVERNENHTRVFQGKLLVKTMEEARTRMASLNLSETQQQRWIAILQQMINADPQRGLSTDDLVDHSQLHEIHAPYNLDDPRQEKSPTVPDHAAAARRVLRTLHDMAEAGLIEKGVVLSAFVRHKVAKGSLQIFRKVSNLEEQMLKVLREESPDAGETGWQDLSLRRLNQRLRDLGFEANPELLRGLLKTLSLDGKGFAGSTGSLQYRQVFQDHYRVKLLRSWEGLSATARKRRAIAGVLLESILSQIPQDASPSGELLVTFATEDLVKALKSHLYLAPTLKDPLAAIDRGLLYLHEQGVIILQQGMAIFRQAMSLRVIEEAKKRRYSKEDHAPLQDHYRERVFQVHVMNEYARLGVEKIGRALELVLAYFSLDKASFVKRYFPGQKAMLERAVSQEAYQKIVEELGNPVQTAVVRSEEDVNLLILAGPGSGKTRIVVHRCAYLMRVQRAAPESILVLCFNHWAAVALRRRLRELLGDHARGVIVQTYHGLAMRLTGTSFAEMAEKSRGQELPFSRLIPDAIRILKGEEDVYGLDPDEVRERIRGGFRHILVDEYQDIDEEQYEFISVLAGRKEKDPDSKLNILAVGDDDQNIYTFRGANVQFIVRFEQEYQARVHHLVENYRSTKHIISAANALIAHNGDRMKVHAPIEVNRGRAEERAGGVWEEMDPVVRGKVQILTVPHRAGQMKALVEEWERMHCLKPGLPWEHMAVLSRSRNNLAAVRALAETLGVPVSWGLTRKSAPPIHRIRELHRYLNFLKEKRTEIFSAASLQKLLRSTDFYEPANPWWDILQEVLQSWEDESGNAELPVSHALEFIHENLQEKRREQRMGRGVFLSTIHGAKGMEFPHVFLLDGDWVEGRTPKEKEEERRIFYVGMTRAEETLCLFQCRDTHNPHLRLLEGDSILRRKGPVHGESLSRAALFPSSESRPNQKPGNDPLGAKGDEGAIAENSSSTFHQLDFQDLMHLRWETLSMEDIVLSFPGRFPANHSIHQRLARLIPGTELIARVHGHTIGLFELQAAENNPLALLSGSASARWRELLHRIGRIRVLAMVQRKQTDGEEKYQSLCRCPWWEIPWIEIFYS